MASKILKMGSRVIFWVGEPPQKFFSKSEGVGEIMLFYFNFDLMETVFAYLCDKVVNYTVVPYNSDISHFQML